MTFTPPDLSQILTNEQEFNTRLNNLRLLVRNELDDLNTSYSSDDSIKSLVGKINNPPAWIIERSSYRLRLSGMEYFISYTICRYGLLVSPVIVKSFKRPVHRMGIIQYGKYQSK